MTSRALSGAVSFAARAAADALQRPKSEDAFALSFVLSLYPLLSRPFSFLLSSVSSFLFIFLFILFYHFFFSLSLLYFNISPYTHIYRIWIFLSLFFDVSPPISSRCLFPLTMIFVSLSLSHPPPSLSLYLYMQLLLLFLSIPCFSLCLNIYLLLTLYLSLPFTFPLSLPDIPTLSNCFPILLPFPLPPHTLSPIAHLPSPFQRARKDAATFYQPWYKYHRVGKVTVGKLPIFLFNI